MLSPNSTVDPGMTDSPKNERVGSPGSSDTSSDSSQPEPNEKESWLEASPGKLSLGLIAGVIFGFLLQKGGVAKFDILVGVLLLENYVVIQVMLTAILVGMIGVEILRRYDLVNLQIKETVYGAQLGGGLLFGVGFALLAYCPGTNAAAVGQGNLDALVGIVGLTLGSYLFALTSRSKQAAISEWGQRGKLTLPALFNVSSKVFVPIAAVVFVGILVWLESISR